MLTTAAIIGNAATSNPLGRDHPGAAADDHAAATTAWKRSASCWFRIPGITEDAAIEIRALVGGFS